jgi:stearoyl-CoA desaturase (delta-9 desaturase)
MGWLLCKKHPDVFKFGSRVSMSDLEADKYVMFQHRHFYPIMFFVSIVIPVFIPCYFWNESFWASFLFAGVVRYIYTLHITWLINSAAHTYGMKPFDK